MKKRQIRFRAGCLVLAMHVTVLAGLAPSAAHAQLKLVQTVAFPNPATEKFDHFGIDLKHGRLFATPETNKCVEVFDIKTGKHLSTIQGIGEPHAVLYRADLNRLYITDGEDGSVRIIDGASYQILKTVKLLVDADSIGYDGATRYLYVTNGGKDAKLDYVMLSVISTDTGEKIGDIKVEGNTLEAMALESGTSRLFINNSAKNTVEVIDRKQQKLVASWPVTLGKMNVAMGLDEANHRLFIGCRDGHLVVMDTENGREIGVFPITKGKTDDMAFDAAKKRIYIATAGVVDVYEQAGPDQYSRLGTAKTAPLAKTASLVPELNRYFVAVPKSDEANAEILVFKVE
jgi:DNA-binding beta-propeller fold protein YncE